MAQKESSEEKEKPEYYIIAVRLPKIYEQVKNSKVKAITVSLECFDSSDSDTLLMGLLARMAMENHKKVTFTA